jgi:hypothetical protein
MVVPIGSTRKTNAEALMNYYYQPEVAAEVAAWVNYVTPVEGAYEAALEIDEEIADNKLIFPDDATLAQTKALELECRRGKRVPSSLPVNRPRRLASRRVSRDVRGFSEKFAEAGADLSLVNVTKRFPGFTAIDDLSHWIFPRDPFLRCSGQVVVGKPQPFGL